MRRLAVDTYAGHLLDRAIRAKDGEFKKIFLR
jgi:hypothetical protein